VDQRQVVRMLAVARVAVGAAALVAPRRSASLVFGDEARSRAFAMIMRSFAVRDLVLGLGTLRALDQDRDPKSWVQAAAVTDAVDAVSSLTGVRALSPARTVLGAASAATAAALGLRAATRLG
jgi:hypothetical protein